MIWLTAVALAGTRDGVEALSRQGADMVLACDSLGQVTEAVERFSDRLGAKQEDALGMIERARGAFVPEAPFTFAMWKTSEGSFESADFYAELSFATLLDAEGVAAQLAGEDAEVRPVKDGVAVGDEWTVRVTDGVAVIREQRERPERPPIDTAALAALPTDSGCVVQMELPGEKEFPGGTFAFHIPFERGQAVRFAMRPNGDPLKEVPRASHAPTVRTVNAPKVLLWVGINLAEMEVPADMDKKEARSFRKVQKYLPMDGLAIAAFPSGGLLSGPMPSVAIDLPLAADWSAEKTAKRMLRIVKTISSKEMRFDIERVSSASFILHPKSEGGFRPDIHVLATEEGVRMATTADLLEDLATPGGQPWLDAGHDSDLFYLRVDPGLLPMLQAPKDTELALGFGLQGSLIVGNIALRGDVEALAEWSERIRDMAKAFGAK